ncbi:MAG: class I SAM-dependent methyltransferase [Clostridia bacterium]|nr:class I SAM-dependent methyltransferase [Clostridia bacterium]
MEIYQDFAEVYDALTEDVTYEKTVEYLEQIFKKHYDKKPKLMLELACGTGSITKLLSEKGYDMIGVDLSEEMLNVAREKCDEGVLLLNQDMTEFELYGTVDVIMCLLDSVNYITEPEKLQKMFRLAENYLEYGGLFVFDINSSYKLKNVIAENTFIRETENIYSVWENEQEPPFVNFILNFFVENTDGSYERFYEEHTERIYEQDEIVSMLKKAGFENIKVYSENSFDAPDNTTERIYFVANKRKNTEIN